MLEIRGREEGEKCGDAHMMNKFKERGKKRAKTMVYDGSMRRVNSLVPEFDCGG